MSRNTNAGMVARKVIEQVKEGKRPNVKEAMLEAGYSLSTAGANQGRITKHKEYRKLVRPFVEEIDDLIAGAINIIREKEKKGTYRDGIEAIDKLKKLKALETGTSTDNIALKIGWDTDKEA